jgi:hypothetical protein
MANITDIWAPWMGKAEAAELINRILAMPRWERWPTDEALGKRLNVTLADRERLGLRTIAPCDMTKQQFAEYRKAKRRMRENLRRQRKRQQAGRKPRSQYIATSLTKQKPWKAEGISRRTWYYRRRLADPVAQVVLPTNSIKSAAQPVQRRPLHRPKSFPPPHAGLTPTKTTPEMTCCNTRKRQH